MKKIKKSTFKKDEDSVQILGVRINSIRLERLLKEIGQRLKRGQKTFIVTPNPEFLVLAQQNPWFKKVLNKAHFAIPDGVGLIWASRLLAVDKIQERITGVDLAEKFLQLAQKRNWRVGIVGARRGKKKERRRLVKRLQQKYQRAKIFALEETLDWQKKKWEIIFACQGMGKQEKWLDENFKKTKALIFMGVGGGLDFLAGLVRRSPECIRNLGFEWVFRLIRQPWRWKRQLTLVKFIYLVLREKWG